MLGKWICADPGVETPVFRKVFEANDIASAKIDISGLGFFVLTVNGRRVSDDLFVPALTDYRPRDTSKFYYPIFDTLTHRVLYRTYDLTGFLKEGENTVEVIVGNGWYRQNERICEGRCSFSDRLTAVFDITVAHPDGSETVVSTDGSEQAFVYPILRSNLFLGEVWDTRISMDDLPETGVQIGDFQPETMERQMCPADRVIRELKPKLVCDKDGRLILDAGENISGWVKLAVKGEAGSRMTLRFAEEMKDGDLWFHSTGAGYTCASGDRQIQTDTFILNGREQVLSPLFVWHGFRYFDIAMEGEAEITALKVQVIHTDLEVRSSFACDDETVNWIYGAYIRSQLTNLHTSIPSDCPHRERLGYTGDGQVCSEAAMLSLGAESVYRKWIQDILDCQNTENGHIQHTAPFMGGGGGPGGWGCAVVVVPYNYYKIYGGRDILEKTWIPMRRWVDYLVMRSENGLVVREEEKGWCLGDWETPEKVVLPEEFVNTCYLVRCIGMMKEIAAVLGENADDLDRIAETAKNALHDKYFADGQYFGGVQGADVFAVWAGLPGSEGLMKRVYEKYDALGRFDTGIFGTDLLIGMLFDSGMGDLAVKLLTSEDENVGFNSMRRKGATTLYEALHDDMQSHNHPMFGACVRHLYSGLMGLKPVSFEKGYSDVIIEPCMNTKIRKASAKIHTGAGDFEVKFDLDAGTVWASVPEGVKGKLLFGGREIPLHEG